MQLGSQLKFSNISGDYHKRELLPALTLLEKANVMSRVQQTQGHGSSLNAMADHNHFKMIMVDVALTQTLLGVTSEQWILNTGHAFINKGSIAEAFVGQELLAYHNARQTAKLYCGDVQVRFCESLRVRFPWATRPSVQA